MVARMKGCMTERNEVSGRVVDFDIDPERRLTADNTSHSTAAMGYTNVRARTIRIGKHDLRQLARRLAKVNPIRRKTREMGKGKFKQHPSEQKLPGALPSDKTAVALPFACAKPVGKKGGIILPYAAAVQQPYRGARRGRATIRQF